MADPIKIEAVVRLNLPAVLNGNYKGLGIALRRAGLEALRGLRAESVRQVRARRAIRAGALREELKLEGPIENAQGEVVWRMHVPGGPLPVSAYPYRQSKSGVSVEIKRGSRAVIRHAFVATMASGHEGVWHRVGPYRRGQRGRYAGKMRQAIEEVYTAGVMGAFREPGFKEALLEHAAAIFERAYNRNVQLLLEVAP